MTSQHYQPVGGQPPFLKSFPLVKPNYSFAKRQRELAKKAKKEEKLQRKTTTPQSEQEATSATPPETPPSPPTEG